MTDKNSVTSQAAKDPSDWVTGDEPATGPQMSYLQTLATDSDAEVPDDITKALGASLAQKGIRVNSVAPGPIWTPLIPATMHEDKVATFGEQTPLGRAGQPAELAPAYVFLASEDASYITGEVIAVTGGMPVTI